MFSLRGGKNRGGARKSKTTKALYRLYGIYNQNILKEVNQVASAKILDAKKEVVSGIQEKLSKAKSAVLVDYRGLTVIQDTEMRAELRKNKVEYKVLKNRMVLRALNNLGYTGFDQALEGPTAVAISYDDPVVPSRILSDCAKKYQKTAVKGGVVEGRCYNAAEMKAVAAIPAKPVLVAQLLGLLTSPARGLAVALDQIAKKQSN